MVTGGHRMKWVWAQKHSRKDPHASGNVQLPDSTAVSTLDVILSCTRLQVSPLRKLDKGYIRVCCVSRSAVSDFFGPHGLEEGQTEYQNCQRYKNNPIYLIAVRYNTF